MNNILEWHDKTLAEHVSLRDSATAKNFRFQSLSIYGDPANPLYAAVMIEWNPFPAQHDYPSLDLAALNQTVASEQAKGFGPAIITATGPANAPVFGVVFEKLVPGAVFEPNMTSGSWTDTSTIQYQMNTQKAAGLILRWGALYGDSADPRFAAIWQPQTSDVVMWDADGLLDSGPTMQQRFNARTSAWGRPFFITSNSSEQYFSAYVNDEIGAYWAQAGIGADDLATQYDQWTTNKGFTPVVLQGSKPTNSASQFSVLWVQDTAPTPRKFTASGPIANGDIDNVIQQALQQSPLRDAALAIVHGKQIVYARGYTLAEPDWPVAQPTSCFRLASDSKTVTALAMYQEIERNPNVTLDTPIQSILHLTTPSGAPPADAKWGQITIRHLLEHTSGINTDAFRDGPSVQAAFHSAGHTIDLPVSRAQTESYIASLPLVFAPGTSQAYNNCGYFLLGRILQRLAKAPDAITAYSQLFKPLGITRIRNAVSLVTDQPSDEARYQTYYYKTPSATANVPPSTVGSSQMSNARPLVPDEYGTEQIEVLEGAGGLSAAVTDIARLIAILLDPDDNPAMKRTTLNEMLNNAVACGSYWSGKVSSARAGHGWDGAGAQANGQFYAQKGGSLDTNHSVVQINGDWGFVMVWAGASWAASSWYPDYPTVMNIAKSVNWTQDLSSAFGMTPLP